MIRMWLKNFIRMITGRRYVTANDKRCLEIMGKSIGELPMTIHYRAPAK